MSSTAAARSLRAAAMAFVAGLVAVTLFRVGVFGDSPADAVLGSLGHAVGAAIGVYLAYAWIGDPS